MSFLEVDVLSSEGGCFADPGDPGRSNCVTTAAQKDDDALPLVGGIGTRNPERLLCSTPSLSSIDASVTLRRDIEA